MKAGWTEVALGEVATIDRQVVGPDEITAGTLYVGLENVLSGGGLRDVAPVAEGQIASGKFMFDSGHVLFGKLRPNLAKSARPDFAGVCSTDILPVRPGGTLDRDYLAHFIALPGTVALATRRAAGANLPRLSPTQLELFRLPLPPLDEQRRIARVLDAAEAVRTMRRRSIESASSFAAALYRTMFGGIHPTCEVTTLGQVSDVTSGITKGRRINGRVLTEVPYLAVSNVQAGHLDMTNVKTIEASEPEIARFRLAPGDLLLTEGGDPDKLGRGTLWSGELDVCIHQNHIFRVRVHDPDQVDPVFLQGQVASAAARSYFLRAAKQTTGIASINRTQLQALPVQLPPIDLQCSFTERLRLAARAVAARERHLAHLDALFVSLQHRAFTGAL